MKVIGNSIHKKQLSSSNDCKLIIIRKPQKQKRNPLGRYEIREKENDGSNDNNNNDDNNNVVIVGIKSLLIVIHHHHY